MSTYFHRPISHRRRDGQRRITVASDHSRLACWSCCGDLDGSWPFKSDKPGVFEQCCERCGAINFYRIRKESNNE